MGKTEIAKEYERVLKENQSAIVGGTDSGTKDRRTHPRLKVKSPDMWISTIPEFALVDMSASGLAIRSNHPLAVGEMISIAFGTGISVDADVISCKMADSPTEYTDGEFHIQCRFLEDLKGMELLVNAIRSN